MVRVVVFCLFLAGSVTAFAAADDLSLSSQVNEGETQLAQRLAQREAAESPFEYSLGVSYRTDNLKWSVATEDVNVASEVRWNDIVVPQIRMGGRIKLGREWFARAYYATGAVWSGDSRDSDYSANDRMQEYSRSTSKAGGAAADFSIGVGKTWTYVEERNNSIVYVSPIAGMSIHTQKLTMHDGRKTIPYNAELAGLDNSYSTQWSGKWLGLEAIVEVQKSFSVLSRVECHWIDYFAEANWNLRSDYRHPVSFEHEANGFGRIVTIGFLYEYSTNTSINVSVETQEWNTDAGRDRTYFSYGATTNNILNPVEWNSKAVSLDVIYEF